MTERAHPLNVEICAVRASVDDLIAELGKGGVPLNFLTEAILGHVARTARLANAICLLMDSFLYREAAILLRSLVETAISVSHLVAEPNEANARAKMFHQSVYSDEAGMVEIYDRLGSPVPEPERTAALKRRDAFKVDMKGAGHGGRNDSWHGQTWAALAKNLGDPEILELYEYGYRGFSSFVHTSFSATQGCGRRESKLVLLAKGDFAPELELIGRQVAITAGRAVEIVRNKAIAGKGIQQPFIDAMVTPGIGVSVTISEEPSLNPERQRNARDAVPRVGRNEACPCGSGKKYKRCHGLRD